MRTKSAVMSFQGHDSAAHHFDKAFYQGIEISAIASVQGPQFWISPACSPLPMPFSFSRLSSPYALNTSVSCVIASRQKCGASTSSPTHGFSSASEAGDGNNGHCNGDTLATDGRGRNRGTDSLIINFLNKGCLRSCLSLVSWNIWF